jgi:hypothetical protein
VRTVLFFSFVSQSSSAPDSQLGLVDPGRGNKNKILTTSDLMSLLVSIELVEEVSSRLQLLGIPSIVELSVHDFLEPNGSNALVSNCIVLLRQLDLYNDKHFTGDHIKTMNEVLAWIFVLVEHSYFLNLQVCIGVVRFGWHSRTSGNHTLIKKSRGL